MSWFDDIINGIGSWFSGGNKKKDEKPKQQPVYRPPTQGQQLLNNGVPTLQTNQQRPKPQQPSMPKPSASSDLVNISKNVQQSINGNKLNAPQQTPAPRPAQPSTNQQIAHNVGQAISHAAAPALKGVEDFGRSVAKNVDAGIVKTAKVADNVNDSYSKWVDTHIDPSSANGKLDSINDVTRFAAKLPVGIVTAPFTAPKDAREALTGERLNTDNQGNITGRTKLTGAQSAGAAANAVINGVGTFMGGSGNLIKSIYKGVAGNVGKEMAVRAGKTAADYATEQAARQVANTAKQGAIKKFMTKPAARLAYDMGEEGAEEGVQSIASDYQDQGHLDSGSINRALESAALGAVGGGMMHGGAHLVNKIAGNEGRVAQNTTARSLDASEAEAARNSGVTERVPTTQGERVENIQNGIVTPETRHLSVQERVATALNSDLNPQRRYRLDDQTPKTYRVNDLSSLDSDRIKFLNSRGYSVAQDASGAKIDLSTGRSVDENLLLDTLNPTGGLYVDYNPQARMKMPLAPNITTYDQTSGVSPDDLVTIYRGAPATQTAINPGDFITTSRDLAQSYAGEGNILEQQVKAKDILDDINDPLGDEYLYRPQVPELKNRLGAPTYDPASRQEMQQVQLENNRMFGVDSPNPEFRDGVILTSDGRTALGETVDNLDGASDISLSKQQKSVEATYFHEAVHKALNDYMTVDERIEIIESYRNDMGRTFANNDIAEEAMAEDFIEYAAEWRKQQAGKDVQSNLSTKIRDLFHRILQRIQMTVLNQSKNRTIDPKYRQFYEDLMSGKFATEQVMDKELRTNTPEELQLRSHAKQLQQQFDTTEDEGARRVINQQLAELNQQIATSARPKMSKEAYRIERDVNGDDVVVINSHLLEGVPRSKHLQVISEYFKRELQGREFELGDGTHAKINAKSRNKMIQPNEDLTMRGKMTKDLPDILKVSKRFASARDSKAHGFAYDGFEYRKARVQVDGKQYDVRLNIGMNKNGKTFYTINNIKESPLVSNIVPSRRGDTGDSIANNDVNVKRYRVTPDLTDAAPTRENLGQDTVRSRRPAVSLEEITSPELKAEGIILTKTDFNNALDEIVADKYPDLHEKLITLDTELEAIGQNDPVQLGGSIRPEDARRLFGSNYTEWLPRNFIRKNAIPIDQQAQERGYNDLDEYVAHITRPLEVRKEIMDTKDKINTLYHDKDLRAEAKELAEIRAYNQRETEAFPTRQASAGGPVLNKQPQQADTFGKLPSDQLATKGNLYAQTKLGVDDITSKPQKDGLYEYRQHEKRRLNEKTKRWEKFHQFERRYIGEGADGAWKPYSRAAYTYLNDRSLDKVAADEKIQIATAEARKEGLSQDFVGVRKPRLDRNNNVAGEEVDVLPITDRGAVTIDGGLVRDARTGDVIGNHIEVTPFGAVYQLGGKHAVLESETFQTMGNKGGIFDTFARMTDKNMGKQDNMFRDLIDEAKEAQARGKEVALENKTVAANAADTALRYKPRNLKEDRYFRALGEYIENKVPMVDMSKEPPLAFETKDDAFAHWYGEDALKGAQGYDRTMRALYDKLIEDANVVRQTLGQPGIEYRKDYMAHVWEDGGLLSQLAREGVNTFSIHGEFAANGRGKIPAWIAGRSDITKPLKRYNKHELARNGAEGYVLDPRVAFDKASDAMVMNTYLEPVIAKGRSIEGAMRALSKVDVNLTGGNKEIGRYVKEDLRNMGYTMPDNPGSMQQVALGDFVNALAGKSNAMDRAANDRATKLMKAARFLLRTNGANKIMGNISSVMAQALSLPDTVRDNGAKNTAWALSHLLSREMREIQAHSAFLRERYTNSTGRFEKGKWQKTTEGVAKWTGMDIVESTFVKANWAANYRTLQSQGLSGRKLILEADRMTARAVGDRSLGAKPQAYDSSLWGIPLQFTYEVNEAWKNNKEHVVALGHAIKNKDGSETFRLSRHGIESIAVGMALNALYESMTGNAPLPDLVGAIIDAVTNASKDDDDETKKNPYVYGATTIGSELAKANPATSALLNAVPKSYREEWFGKDNDFGRFDGATGVAQTLTNVGDAAMRVGNGDWSGAKDSALGVVPMGSQIKKTIGGVSAMSEGAARTSNGNLLTPVDNTNPLNWLKAVLFGKNALGEVKQAYDNQQYGTTKDQTKIYEQIKSAAGADAARNYLNRVQSSKGKKDSQKENASVAELKAKLDIAIEKGKRYIGDDGVVYNENNKVDREYYRDRAKAMGDTQSDDAYSAYLRGYSLEPGTKQDTKEVSAAKSTGNPILDKLMQNDSSRDSSPVSVNNRAVGLLKDTDKYKDVPDWVKDRFYKEAGLTKEDVTYGALASYSAATKLTNYYRPIAQESDHQKLLDTLNKDRRQSIYTSNGKAKVAAQDDVITALQKEGYLTKEEAKALKSVQYDKSGKTIATKSGSSGGRKGAGKGEYTSKDIKDYLKSTNSHSGLDLVSLLRKYGDKSMSVAKPKATSPRMRSMSPRKSGLKRGSKMSTTRIL